jgi:hypothetical protein
MRALLGILVITAVLVAATEPDPPRGKLADLRSNGAYLLEQSDGVARVERLVAPRRPRHRIIHIAHLHLVDRDELAADLRDQFSGVTEEEIDAEYRGVLAAVRRIQSGQRRLLRWLGKYEDVRVVYLEGLTDSDKVAYAAMIRLVKTGKLDPTLIGATGQALHLGYIDAVEPAEDEAAYLAADPFSGESVAFEGAANDARERAIVRRLVKSGPLSVVVLGAAHDLSQHVRAVGDCELLRVTVEGWPDSGVAHNSLPMTSMHTESKSNNPAP